MVGCQIHDFLKLRMQSRLAFKVKIKMICMILVFQSVLLSKSGHAHKARFTGRIETKGAGQVTDIGDFDVEALVSHESIVSHKK